MNHIEKCVNLITYIYIYYITNNNNIYIYIHVDYVIGIICDLSSMVSIIRNKLVIKLISKI